MNDSGYRNPFVWKKTQTPVQQRDLEEKLIDDQQGLVLTGLGKNFGSFKALENINMKILPGEVVSLLGHNGAGKSTLINIITGIYEPSQGEIIYNK